MIELLVVVAIIGLLVAILLPALARARNSAQAAQCLSNLHQFLLAAHTYVHSSKDYFPSAFDRDPFPPAAFPQATKDLRIFWDFKRIRDRATGQITIEPGLLWMGKTNLEIQQCPVFEGSAQSPDEPYTGYNYNTSYVGHALGESTSNFGPPKYMKPPARITEIRRPGACAVFGDGEYGDGANKFMRAPDPKNVDGTVNDGDESFSGREGGTQGYRHLGNTNVGFADGHAVAWRHRHLFPDPEEAKKIALGTGFLTPDNRLYDLK